MPFFKDTTLLITHYNRSNSLERLLKRFRELELNFEEVVVSDDGSKPEHLDRLKEMEGQYGYRLVTAPKNKGLANNLNKGQAAVKTPFTLYVQEDFDPRPIFVEKLANAVQFITERPEIDMVRFYAYWKYPFLKPYKNGFSEMDF
ncbi:MAG: glycosyltransferase, partial [Gemmatimonadaceae bacterium]|nr:glycosyltransferase [Chitinophagaceae bacterium]